MLDNGTKLETNIENFEWKPLYPNNMKCNGLDGYYCLMLYKHKDGTISARKYTIVFQHKEVTPATGYINQNEVDRYVLFEKSYGNIIGPLEHPEPTDEWQCFSFEDKNTFNAHDVNDYGGFVYAYENLELAKQRACTQYNHIYGYVMSFLREDEK